MPASRLKHRDEEQGRCSLTYIQTWDNVTKPNGSHGDEAEVECIKESDILMNTEEVGTNAEEADENQKTAKSYSNIVCKANIFPLVTEIMRWKCE